MTHTSFLGLNAKCSKKKPYRYVFIKHLITSFRWTILLMTFSMLMDRNTPIADGVVLEFTNHHVGKQINQMTQNLAYNLHTTCRSRVRKS